MKQTRAFTLIELLITVAIIAILAAIAVPNFLEAQTRAKVSASKGGLHTLQVGLEAYLVDNNHYPYCETIGTDSPANGAKYLPPGGMPRSAGGPGAMAGGLTSPVAYLTTVPDDPFKHLMNGLPIIGPLYYEKAGFGVISNQVTSEFEVEVPQDALGTNKLNGVGPDVDVDEEQKTPAAYVLFSVGPDLAFDASPTIESRFNLNNRYDPTNGTVSAGNVLRFPGGVNFP